MGVPKRYSIMLLTELHLKSDLLKECCESITLVNSAQEVWLSPDVEVNKKISSKMYAIKNVPNYLNVNFYDDKSYSSKNFAPLKASQCPWETIPI